MLKSEMTCRCSNLWGKAETLSSTLDFAMAQHAMPASCGLDQRGESKLTVPMYPEGRVARSTTRAKCDQGNPGLFLHQAFGLSTRMSCAITALTEPPLSLPNRTMEKRSSVPFLHPVVKSSSAMGPVKG